MSETNCRRGWIVDHADDRGCTVVEVEAHGAWPSGYTVAGRGWVPRLYASSEQAVSSWAWPLEERARRLVDEVAQLRAALEHGVVRRPLE